MRHVALGMLLFLTSCQPADQPASSMIEGRWYMDQVMDGEEDVTAQHNPANNRWVEFSSDGHFVSDGDPHGRNTGTWTLDAATNELYLDSDAGEDDDSYWIIAIEGDEMRWQGARSEFTERFTLVHRRR